MEIYIEYFLIDNIIINLIVLYLVGFTSRVKLNKFLMLFVSLLGAIFSVVYSFLNLTRVFDFIYKILIGIVMILCLKKFKSCKQFLIFYILFVTYTFVAGGFCYAILSFLKIDTNSSNIFIYNFEIPISLFILCIFAYLLLLVKLIAYLVKRNSIDQFYYDLVLKVNGKDFLVKAYLDTGNKLFDTNMQKGVNVLSLGIFCKIFKGFPMQKILLNNVTKDDLLNDHYINWNTVNSKEKMLIFEIDEIQIKNKKNTITQKNVLFGLSKKDFTDFDCLLNMDYFVWGYYEGNKLFKIVVIKNF